MLSLDAHQSNEPVEKSRQTGERWAAWEPGVSWRGNGVTIEACDANCAALEPRAVAPAGNGSSALSASERARCCIQCRARAFYGSRRRRLYAGKDGV